MEIRTIMQNGGHAVRNAEVSCFFLCSLDVNLIIRVWALLLFGARCNKT
jgi:hypothetical protein